MEAVRFRTETGSHLKAKLNGQNADGLNPTLREGAPVPDSMHIAAKQQSGAAALDKVRGGEQFSEGRKKIPIAGKFEMSVKYFGWRSRSIASSSLLSYRR